MTKHEPQWIKLSETKSVCGLCSQIKRERKKEMIQCKLCGTPLGSEPTTEELKSHWIYMHHWHYNEYQTLTPEEAILKSRK